MMGGEQMNSQHNLSSSVRFISVLSISVRFVHINQFSVYHKYGMCVICNIYANVPFPTSIKILLLSRNHPDFDTF
jgi:hypothetical protein